MSTVKKITKAEAIRLLEQAVAKKGKDYVDPALGEHGTCTYVSDDGPSCIVGHALHSAGVPLQVLRDVDGGDAKVAAIEDNGRVSVGVARFPAYCKDVLHYVEQETGVVVTPAARRALSDAQNVQDSGGTWGKALTAAKYNPKAGY